MKTMKWMCALLVVSAVACPANAADFLGLEEGSPSLKSARQLTFGPHGVLFVGDAKAATVFALDTGDKEEVKDKQPVNVGKLQEKLGAALGVAGSEVKLNDVAVNPLSGNVYLAVHKGEAPAIVRVDASGKVSELSLKKIKYSAAALPDAPEDKVVTRGRRSSNRRDDSITDLAYVEGQLLVSGLSDGDSPSSVRALAFPFSKTGQTAQLEIYHGAHGRYENYSAIRTFVPFTIDGKPNLLAGFVCTPLVKFPLDSVSQGKSIRGTTVAELGNRNRPYDMIVYKKDGKNYLLMANSARGVMKISTEDIERSQGITERVGGGGTSGQKYETVSDWKDVVQLDKLDEYAAVVVTDKDGDLTLQTLELP